MNSPTTQALAGGALGMALLHIERGDYAAAQPLLTEAVGCGVSTGANASLFHGAPALEFVLGRAGHYDRGLHAAVDRVVADRLALAIRRSQSAQFPHLAEFDLIQGLTGLGALLLTRAASSPLLHEVLTYLVSLARPVNTDGAALPGWWSRTGPGRKENPGGHGNNGMAHGIAGPLALLSVAARCGVQVAGQSDAIETFTHWLDRFGACYWITRDQLSADELPQAPPTRPSWCYGDLGIARAMQLAAVALSDPACRQAAEDIALAAITDPTRLGRITDSSLCHGWAGVLIVTKAIAADSPAPDRFAACLRQLSERLSSGMAALSKPGFMEGRAGAQLALDGTNTTGWTRVLMID